jgi:beta-lactamase superfamily II metal-dependent hydrolase
MRAALTFVLLTLCLSFVLVADVVVPSSDVTTRVIVRKTASSQSARVGSLEPGQQAELIGTVPNWYEIRLPSSLIGFVPKRWTDVITSGTPAPAPATTQTFTIDAVDVGTGLGVLVRGADFTLIYDGGSNDDLARAPNNRMLAYLKLVMPTLQVIDHLILSHDHGPPYT